MKRILACLLLAFTTPVFASDLDPVPSDLLVVSAEQSTPPANCPCPEGCNCNEGENCQCQNMAISRKSRTAPVQAGACANGTCSVASAPVQAAGSCANGSCSVGNVGSTRTVGRSAGSSERRSIFNIFRGRNRAGSCSSGSCGG